MIRVFLVGSAEGSVPMLLMHSVCSVVCVCVCA